MNSIKVKLQNVSPSFAQKSWVSMGIPKKLSTELDGFNAVCKLADGRAFESAIRGQELFVHADLGANETIVVECFPLEKGDKDFTFSPWITDELIRMVPQFVLKTASGAGMLSQPLVFWDGKGPAPSAYYRLEQDLDIRKRFFFHTLIPEAPMVIEGWYDYYSGQEMVPLTIRATYGNVSSEAVLSKAFGALSMFIGEKPVIDFSKNKGAHPVIWRTDSSLWEAELVSPRAWWKARVVESFGAILAMPPYGRIGSEMNTDPNFLSKVISLKAREEAPICAIADVWENEWLAFGAVPKVSRDSQAEIARSYANLLRRLNTPGDEYNQRDYAQPANSGQTGEQPDFGASKCELAVTLKQPWALFDYRYSCQAWMLRPYAHKEADWSPIKAANHPNAKLYNMVVDTRFSADDMLGLPNPMPYNEFWTGSDVQHRSDNLLLGMYALTRDPSLRATILDLIECQKMEIRPWRLFPPNGSIESPRGWGRPLMAMAHLISLGFDEVREYLGDMVNTMVNNAAMNNLPKDDLHSVRTLSRHGFKYGWLDPSGNQIEAWVTWEESIAAMGLWAAYKATGDVRAKNLCLDIAKTITKHAFFKAVDNKWYACYTVKFNTADYGIPLLAGEYTLDPNSQSVFVYGMQRWLLPSLKLLAANSPVFDEATVRAKEIINFFGTQPANITDSGWWAVV